MALATLAEPMRYYLQHLAEGDLLYTVPLRALILGMGMTLGWVAAGGAVPRAVSVGYTRSVVICLRLAVVAVVGSIAGLILPAGVPAVQGGEGLVVVGVVLVLVGLVPLARLLANVGSDTGQ